MKIDSSTAGWSAKGFGVTTVSPRNMSTGSHIQARFTGNQEQEYRWFAIAARLPGTATNATNAARKIVRALATGSVRDLDWAAGDLRRAPFQYRSRANSGLAIAA